MALGLQLLLIYSITFFQKASIILNGKVVPSEILKFSGEIVEAVIIATHPGCACKLKRSS